MKTILFLMAALLTMTGCESQDPVNVEAEKRIAGIGEFSWQRGSLEADTESFYIFYEPCRSDGTHAAPCGSCLICVKSVGNL